MLNHLVCQEPRANARMRKRKGNHYNHAAVNKLPNRSFHPITLGVACVAMPRRWIYLSRMPARKSDSHDFACLFAAVHFDNESHGRASPLTCPFSHQTRVSLGSVRIRCIEVHASRKLTVSSGTSRVESELLTKGTPSLEASSASVAIE